MGASTEAFWYLVIASSNAVCTTDKAGCKLSRPVSPELASPARTIGLSVQRKMLPSARTQTILLQIILYEFNQALLDKYRPGHVRLQPATVVSSYSQGARLGARSAVQQRERQKNCFALLLTTLAVL
jgi:hypothetical protein